MKNIIILILCCFSSIFKAQDFGNLAKYSHANDSIIASKKPVTTIFMGDSITEFWNPKDKDFFAQHQIINRGISGQTTSQMLLRFRQDVIHLHPKQVVILAGINDIAQNTGPISIENTFANIISMVELAKMNKIKVVISSVLPAFDFYWKKGLEPSGKVIALNILLRDYAQKNKIPYVDYFSKMKDDRNGLPAQYSDDDIHPNEVGYQVMQKILTPYLIK